MTLPCPPLNPYVPPALGHLPEWGAAPLALLDAGAGAARAAGLDLFTLQLGRPAVVGFSPEWNRAVLTGPATFRSRGSFSSLVPYLNGGVIVTDAPEHADRRSKLNPGFSRAALAGMTDALRRRLSPFPAGPTDALAWADTTVRQLLNTAYFAGEFDDALLARFLAPLRRPFPAPLLPRPATLAAVRRELLRLGRARATRSRPDLLTALVQQPGWMEDTRVSLAAAHDTTTHALAYAVWALAQRPDLQTPEQHPAVIKEVLRLYPPGWMGSRRLGCDLNWHGHILPAGTLALYSTYLTHRDPALWEDPDTFRPQRWAQKPPAWAYLPFGGGERTCLGMHLANLLLGETLAALPPLRALAGNAAPLPGLTLGPSGPLWVERA
ncbi:cytochrome P450 [Deinococcus sp. SL84]|uniref:cytochrome P450 n=1 Tax=Deinococcus sp. SL84 TaxID=2994663 RepID=UPI00227523B5|nr:cytochrome P450 [Deinococcus sp. SL84]MCY1702490.1 cytochrome P450 [Deinococcus sp. SL84]